mmetsp:Transcript_765/g.2229  ORF Transcript_765/g.2229 Transcript_765/m.2229 type:complete len:120 (+) Transcript_765:767-1126(+)
MPKERNRSCQVAHRKDVEVKEEGNRSRHCMNFLVIFFVDAFSLNSCNGVLSSKPTIATIFLVINEQFQPSQPGIPTLCGIAEQISLYILFVLFARIYVFRSPFLQLNSKISWFLLRISR